MVISSALLLARCCCISMLLLSLTTSSTTAAADASAQSSSPSHSSSSKALASAASKAATTTVATVSNSNSAPCQYSLRGRTTTALLKGSSPCEIRLVLPPPRPGILLQFNISLLIQGQEMPAGIRPQETSRTTAKSSKESSHLSSSPSSSSLPYQPAISASSTSKESNSSAQRSSHQSSSSTPPTETTQPSGLSSSSSQPSTSLIYSTLIAQDSSVTKGAYNTSKNNKSYEKERDGNGHEASPKHHSHVSKVGLDQLDPVDSGEGQGLKSNGDGHKEHVHSNKNSSRSSNIKDSDENDPSGDGIHDIDRGPSSRRTKGGNSQTRHHRFGFNNSLNVCRLTLEIEATDEELQRSGPQVVCVGSTDEANHEVVFIYHYTGSVLIIAKWLPLNLEHHDLSLDYSYVSGDDVNCQLQCQNSPLCLLKSQVCDGRPECPDKDDETDQCPTGALTEVSMPHMKFSIPVIVCVMVVVVCIIIFIVLRRHHSRCRAGSNHTRDSLLHQQQHSNSSEMYQPASGSSHDHTLYDQSEALLQEQQNPHGIMLQTDLTSNTCNVRCSQANTKQTPKQGQCQYNSHQQNNFNSHNPNYSYQQTQAQHTPPTSTTSKTSLSQVLVPKQKPKADGHGNSDHHQSNLAMHDCRRSLPPHIPISRDGEEGYAAAQRMLNSKESQKRNWLAQHDVFRPPPNKTVFDRDSPPPPYSVNPPGGTSILRLGRHGKSKSQPSPSASRISGCHSLPCQHRASIECGCSSLPWEPPDYHSVTASSPPPSQPGKPPPAWEASNEQETGDTVEEESQSEGHTQIAQRFGSCNISECSSTYPSCSEAELEHASSSHQWDHPPPLPPLSASPACPSTPVSVSALMDTSIFEMDSNSPSVCPNQGDLMRLASSSSPTSSGQPEQGAWSRPVSEADVVGNLCLENAGQAHESAATSLPTCSSGVILPPPNSLPSSLSSSPTLISPSPSPSPSSSAPTPPYMLWKSNNPSQTYQQLPNFSKWPNNAAHHCNIRMDSDVYRHNNNNNSNSNNNVGNCHDDHDPGPDYTSGFLSGSGHYPICLSPPHYYHHHPNHHTHHLQPQHHPHLQDPHSSPTLTSHLPFNWNPCCQSPSTTPCGHSQPSQQQPLPPPRSGSLGLQVSLDNTTSNNQGRQADSNSCTNANTPHKELFAKSEKNGNVQTLVSPRDDNGNANFNPKPLDVVDSSLLDAELISSSKRKLDLASNSVQAPEGSVPEKNQPSTPDFQFCGDNGLQNAGSVVNLNPTHGLVHRVHDSTVLKVGPTQGTDWSASH